MGLNGQPACGLAWTALVRAYPPNAWNKATVSA
jgi:hypothetical protein